MQVCMGAEEGGEYVDKYLRWKYRLMLFIV